MPLAPLEKKKDCTLVKPQHCKVNTTAYLTNRCNKENPKNKILAGPAPDAVALKVFFL